MNSSIWSIDWALTGFTNSGQSGLESNPNEVILQSFTKPQACRCSLVSQSGHLFGGGFLPLWKVAVGGFYSPCWQAGIEMKIENLGYVCVGDGLHSDSKYKLLEPW